MKRSIAFACILVAAQMSAPATARDLGLERGLAITDPDTLERIEKKGMSLVALLSPGWTRGADAPLGDNKALSGIPSMKAVMSGIERAVGETRTNNPGSGVGIFEFPTKRLFDVKYLSDPQARFALVGAVQRLDRAYKQPATCGEIRLLYRLQYQKTVAGVAARSRLPMTFNLVFKAKAEGAPLTCQDIARRWIAAGDSSLKGEQFIDFLFSDKGPMSLYEPGLIERIETNLQTLREPITATKLNIRMGGNAEYVLRVFDWSTASKSFYPALLENMIDRDKLRKGSALLAKFKTWLFEPANVRALDDGTLLFPSEYLANRASSFAPGGAARSGNRPFYELIADQELAEVIKRANQPAGALKNIKSPAGFQARLNDMTCVGCHQSRAIGGFHFMGADNAASKKHLPENAIFVPASAHFYGEAPRRRRVLDAIAAGKSPDFSRGFSLRPSPLQLDDKSRNPTINLRGTGFYNGWSAPCYSHPRKDASFQNWTCKSGLKCVITHDFAEDPGHGACMTKDSYAVGDAAEIGKMVSAGFSKDDFLRVAPPTGKDLTTNISVDRRTFHAAPQGGGFFGGMIYKKKCTLPFPPTTVCAYHAGDGFNTCLGKSGGDFKKCFREPFSEKVGLRECDTNIPCRDDYICIATPNKTSGVCLPPYFMMQFRVDGHPR